MKLLQEKNKKLGPQTDDELHAWILENLGYNIPRTAVCDDHQTPFEFIADIYFERVDSAIAIASRDGGKTMCSALIHLLNSLFKPGTESITVGAIWAQSYRAYENLRKLLKAHGKVKDVEKHPEVIKMTQERTQFVNSSTVEILPGTISAVNGPHGQKVHRDEVELMDAETFKEANNISSSKIIIDYDADGKEIKKEIKAQDWITSTRKYAHGQMQGLIDGIDEAERNGFKPTYKKYAWCVFECGQKVLNCRVAYPNLPDEEKCDCHTVVKGEWDDESPRRFSDVCRGRLARSDGYTSLSDIQKKFLENDRDTWEAQKECSKPEVGGLIFPMFTKQRYGIKFYEPDPMYGDIYLAWDPGGSNPHAVNWYQVLDHALDVYGHDQDGKEEPIKRLKAGTVVCFDEIYKAEIGNTEIAELVVLKEDGWRKKYPKFKVKRRFADVAAKAARLDWARHSPKLPTSYYVTREVKEHIKTCTSYLQDDMFVVDTKRCPMFVNEAESWAWKKARPGVIDAPEEPVKDFDHCLASGTIIQTKQGLRMVDDLKGLEIDVLTIDGTYRPAKWKSYGIQSVYEIEFDNGEIYKATDEHQWIVMDRKEKRKRVKTKELIGKRVLCQPAKWDVLNEKIYNAGIRNGLIYGDGTTYGVQNGKYNYSLLRQYGDENCTLVEQYFEGRHGERKESSHLGVKIQTKGFPVELKQLPIIEELDYIRGFIAGLIAADGAVNKQGCCYIATSKMEDVDEIIRLCRTVGIMVSNVERRKPGPQNYPNAKDQFRIWITKASLDETILLKASHRINGLKKTKWIVPYTRKVIAVRLAGLSEVYCCEEPITNTFVLGTGIVTSNCMSEFRYAMENIKYIARRTPTNSKPKYGQKKHIIKNVAKSSAPRYLPRDGR